MRLPIFSASSRSWLTKMMVFLSSFCSIEELVLQLVADQRIERRERLVHEQDVGVGGEGAGEADALLHAAGQLVAEFARPIATGRPWRASRRRFGAISAFGMPRSSSPKPTFSRTVRQGSSANCWNTMAMRLVRSIAQFVRRCSVATSIVRPSCSTRTLPRATLLRPLTARRIVDLPEPDRPISTQISPSLDGEIDAGGAENGAGRGEDLVARPALVDQRAAPSAACRRRRCRRPRIRPRRSSHALDSSLGVACRRDRARWRGGRWRGRPRSPSGC